MSYSTNFTNNHELAVNFSEFACGIGFVEREAIHEGWEARYLIERTRNEAALEMAIRDMRGPHPLTPSPKHRSFLAWERGNFNPLSLPLLFLGEGGRGDEGLTWHHDGWGKPYVKVNGTHDPFLHVSNTHDGERHLVIAAYGQILAGIGIDVVYLPRLQRSDKGRDYLRRFARQFMSEAEFIAFSSAAETDSDAEFTIRAAAHFSLMESASKACGTGLKIGIGMGKAYSLPKQSIEIRQLVPKVELEFTGEARNRIEQMGVLRSMTNWTVDGDYLTSVTALLRNDSV